MTWVLELIGILFPIVGVSLLLVITLIILPIFLIEKKIREVRGGPRINHDYVVWWIYKQIIKILLIAIAIGILANLLVLGLNQLHHTVKWLPDWFF